MECLVFTLPPPPPPPPTPLSLSFSSLYKTVVVEKTYCVQELICSQQEAGQRAACLEEHGHVPEDVSDSMQDSATAPSPPMHSAPHILDPAVAPTPAPSAPVSDVPAVSTHCQKPQSMVGPHPLGGSWPRTSQAGHASQAIGPHTQDFLHLRLTQGVCDAALHSQHAQAVPRHQAHQHLHKMVLHSAAASQGDTRQPLPTIRPFSATAAAAVDGQHARLAKISDQRASEPRPSEPAGFGAPVPGLQAAQLEEQRHRAAAAEAADTAMCSVQRGSSQAWLGGGTQAGTLSLQFTLTDDGPDQEVTGDGDLDHLQQLIGTAHAAPGMHAADLGTAQKMAGDHNNALDEHRAGSNGCARAHTAVCGDEGEKASPQPSWLQGHEQLQHEMSIQDSPEALAAGGEIADSEAQLDLHFTLPPPSQCMFPSLDGVDKNLCEVSMPKTHDAEPTAPVNGMQSANGGQSEAVGISLTLNPAKGAGQQSSMGALAATNMKSQQLPEAAAIAPSPDFSLKPAGVTMPGFRAGHLFTSSAQETPALLNNTSNDAVSIRAKVQLPAAAAKWEGQQAGDKSARTRIPAAACSSAWVLGGWTPNLQIGSAGLSDQNELHEDSMEKPGSRPSSASPGFPGTFCGSSPAA